MQTDAYLNSPVVIWAGIIVATLVIISTALPKIMGPLSQAIHDWASARRQAGVDREDAEIVDLREDNDYLRRVSSARLNDIQERDRILVEHRRWDQDRMNDPGCNVLNPPPPLWPSAEFYRSNFEGQHDPESPE